MLFQFKTIFTALFFFLFFANLVSGQTKKPLDHSVYDDWKEIKNVIISADGKYAAFEVNPQKGDGELSIYNSISGERIIIERGSKPKFGPNSSYVAFNIKPQYDTVRAKKLRKVKKDKLPKD